MSIVSRLFGQLPQAPKELELLPQIEQLANAPDWESAQRVVTENPTLLGDLASALILELAKAARQQGNEAVALDAGGHPAVAGHRPCPRNRAGIP